MAMCPDKDPIKPIQYLNGFQLNGRSFYPGEESLKYKVVIDPVTDCYWSLIIKPRPNNFTSWILQNQILLSVQSKYLANLKVQTIWLHQWHNTAITYC